MKLTIQEIKKRYFDRAYENAPEILCACGCGTIIKSKNHYGRKVTFVSGHNNRKYDDPKQVKREWNHRNRGKRQKYKVERIHKLKSELIKLLGSKCQCCELEFDGDCVSIFDFHHRDPKTKKFNLGMGTLGNHSLKEVKEEVKKCDLLCANCHRLVHWDWRYIEDV